MDKTRIVIMLASLLVLALLISCKMEETDVTDNGTLIRRGKPRTEYEPDEITAQDTSAVAKTGKKVDKKTSLDRFEYSWTDSKDIPDIVIIVDDFGNSTALLEDFAKLPSEVVFAVLPDLSATVRSGQVASQYGHEVMIHFPMLAAPTSNPGKRYIKPTSTREEIAELLADFKTQLPMAIAANNHMGSSVTSTREAMEHLYKELHSRGLFFVDSFTTSASVAGSVARTLGYPPLRRDMFLDVSDRPDEHKANSDESLAFKISSLAKYKGRREPIIIITHCHNREKLDALQKFITQIQGMGLKLTTITRAKGIAA